MLNLDSKRAKIENAAGSSSDEQLDVSNATEEPTIFDEILNPDCMNELLDWLPLNSLCALSQTCRSLQRTVRTYFKWKYPSAVFELGDEFVFNAQHVKCFGDNVQAVTLYDSSIVDFDFAGSNINPNLRDLAFEKTYKLKENCITKEHIETIKPILHSVKTVSVVECNLVEGCVEYLLDCCTKIEDISFRIGKNMRKNWFQLEKYPTIRNVGINFCAKANVVRDAINTIKEQTVQLDELVLAFYKEHDHLLDFVFKELDAMYERKFFKRLYLGFEKKSMVSEHIDRIAKLQGLIGLSCSYTINTSLDNHIADIAKLQNLKFLNINWLLENADVVAQQLQQLIEIEMKVASIDAIVSFVRYSTMLSRFHIEQVRMNKDKCTKFNAFTLNKRRSMLEYARKLTIYIPEEKFIKLKWAMVAMDSNLVEITREESCIPLKKENL